MEPTLLSLPEFVRLADVADVLLVAGLFFFAITAVRRTQSGSAARRLLALVSVYALVYLAADVFDLYLMRRVLGVLFFVVLIALVVVFQSDIRRLLDQLGSWTGRGGRRGAESRSPLSMLQESVTQLAQERTGALIAIRGSEPWESHLHGGIELDGKLSLPLLHSIFQPDSPGHDGALLVEGERGSRFAVHLPLATRVPEASRYGGTRHSAGLGLSEQCDALVIIVSEERGTISLAEGGRLVEVSAAELGERLDRFWQQHYAERDASARGWFGRRTAETGALSLALAVLTWFVFVYSVDVVSRTYRAPIEVRNLPAEWRMENDSVPSALVTLSGSAQAFERLRPGELRVSLDLSDPDPGRNEIAITEEALSLPSGIDLAAADPPAVSLELERQRAVTLPVQVRVEGALPEGSEVVPSPGEVEVLVPERDGPAPDAIPTRPVEAGRLSRGEAGPVQLLLPEGVRLAPGAPAEVEVRLRRPSPRG